MTDPSVAPDAASVPASPRTRDPLDVVTDLDVEALGGRAGLVRGTLTDGAVRVDDTFCSLTGLERSAACGWRWIDAVDRGDRERLWRALHAACTSGARSDFPVRLASDATPGPVRVIVTGVEADDGTYAFVVSFSPAARRGGGGESTDPFPTLLDAMPVGLAYAGPDGVVEYANRAWVELTGVAVDDALADGLALDPADAMATALFAGTPFSGLRDLGAPTHISIEPVGGDAGGFALVAAAPEVPPSGAATESFDELMAPLRSLLDASPDYAAVLEAGSTTFAYVNGPAAELLGAAEPADLVGTDSSALIRFARDGADAGRSDDEVRAEFAATAAARLHEHGSMFATGELGVGEHALPVSMLLFSIRDSRGTHRAVLCIARDQREMRDARAAVEASERWYRALVQHGSTMVSVLDEQLRPRFVSPLSIEVLGYTPDQLVGSAQREIVDEDDRAMLRAALVEVRDGRGPAEVEYRVRRHDGESRLLATMIESHLDDPVIRGIVLASRDVTDARRSEEAGARSQAALDTLVRSAPIPIYAVDLDGRVQVWNPASERLFGWTADEVLGEPLPFLTADQAERSEAARPRLLAGETLQRTAEFVVRDGRRVALAVATSPISVADGPVTSFVTVAVDVTERIRAAEDLERRAQVDRFLADLTQRLLDATAETLEERIEPALADIGAWARAGGVSLHLGDRACFVWPADATPPALHPDDAATDGPFVRQDAAGNVVRAGWSLQAGSGFHRALVLDFDDAPDLSVDDLGPLHALVTAFVATVERAQAEAAVRDSEERFRGLVQNLAEGVTVIGTDGNVKYSTPSAARMMGYTGGEGDGRDPLDFVVEEDRARVADVVARAFAEPGIHGPVTLRVAGDNGVVRVVEALGHNRLDDPAVEGVVVTARDVTDRVAAERAAARTEARFAALVENMSDVITVVATDGTMLYSSPTSERLFGYVAGDVSSTDPMSCIHPEDRDIVVTRLTRQMRDGTGAPVQYRLRTADGEWRVVESNARDLTADPAVEGIVITTRDVSDRTRAEQLVADQARVLAGMARGVPLAETLESVCAVLEHQIPDARFGVLLVDRELGVLRLGGGSSLPAEIATSLDAVPLGAETPEAGDGPDRVADRVGAWVERLRALSRPAGCDGVLATPVLDSEHRDVIGLITGFVPEPRFATPAERDVIRAFAQTASIAIERQVAQDLLAFRAHHDSLTGLPNRVLFVEFLDRALARRAREGSAAAVLFLDLDRFKHVNDTLGHDAGDALLRSLSHRLHAVMRPSDVVARFGGDEFTVLCDDLDPERAEEQACSIARRLLDVVETPIDLEGEECRLSASMGIAVATHASTSDVLLRDADAAMYEAKQNGKSRWEVFDDDMRSSFRARLDLEAHLSRAVENEELRLLVQPIVDLATGECVGGEALLRWAHPLAGLVPPTEFISLAEDTGLIIPIGEWALATACRTVADWEEQELLPPGWTMSVNLSARQVAQPDLAAKVRDVIARSGPTASRICLEITESVLMEESSVAVMRSLRELGVSLSIDDFGTGYSSLGYLKRFPVDSVKVDRSFVDGLGTEGEDSAIVDAVVSLGHALGLSVVAEGVETAAQLQALLRLGCERAQGYWFSAPRPIEDFAGMLRRQPWSGARSAWAS